MKYIRCSFGGLACTVFSSIVITRKPQSEHLVFFRRSFSAYPIFSYHGRPVLSCTSINPTFSRFVGSFFPVLSAWIPPYFPITVAHSSYPSWQHSLLSSRWIIRSKINITVPFHRLVSEDVLLSVELGSRVRFIMCADSCDWFESFVTIEVYYG